MIKIISILNLCWEHIFSLHWSHLAKTHHNPAWLWWCKSRINMSFHWRFFSGLNYVLGIFSLPSSNQFRASFYEPGSKVYSVTFMNKMSLLFFVLKVEPIEVGKKSITAIIGLWIFIIKTGLTQLTIAVFLICNT